MSNIVLNPGSLGATLGTDQVAGIDYQKVKVAFSTDGVTPQSVDATHGLPVAVVAALPTGANTVGAVTQAAGPWTSNLTQLLGTAVATGNGVSGAGVLRVAICSDNTSLANAIPVAQSGTWNVNLGTLNGVALDTSVNGLLVAQSAALGTNKGPLVQGSVTTAAPTYTTGNINPLSLTTAGALRVDGSGVTQPVSGTVTTTPPANASSNVAQINGVAPLMGNGVTGTGSLRVTISSDNTPYSVNAVQSGVYTVQPGNTANTTPWLVTDTPATSGGLSFSYTLSAASSNLTQAKGTAGQLFTVVVTNTNAAPRYLKIFNKASASVTMGTTAADFQFVIPGNTAGAGLAINIDKGLAMSTGISYAITAGVALNDNTSVAANEVSALLGFK